MAAETLAPAVKVRETADCETPASRATSIDEAYFLAAGGLLEHCVPDCG